MSNIEHEHPVPVSRTDDQSRSGGGSLPKYFTRIRRVDWRLSCAVLLMVILVTVWRATTTHAKPEAQHSAPVTVAVAKVQRESLTQELTCDAELRPYQEIDLHAKVAGYLQSINVDIGDRVETGQLLATIEVPELEDDILRAKAGLKRSQDGVANAQAAYDEAHLVYSRVSAIAKAQPKLIAQQELDAALEKDQTTVSALSAAKSEVDVNAAELRKLQTMLRYSSITAPFAGVITKRYADPGALIQAGTSSSTQTLPLVRLSQNDRLRLDIPVSVSYVSRIHVGDPVEIRVASLEKPLNGVIARTCRKIETATRTMEVEVDVPNADLSLIPGMYASAVLRLDHRDNALTVPVQAVSRAKACSVFVVGRDNRLEERPVRLGLETPDGLEVVDGLHENEMVMIGSRAQLAAGQQVQPKFIDQTNLKE